MNRKYIIVADDSIKGFDEEIAKLEREWGAEEIEPSEDAVSREAVLELAKKGILVSNDNYKCVVNAIKSLPPVKPTNEDIKEAYLKGYDYGVKDWFKAKTQPSEDVISREAVDKLSRDLVHVTRDKADFLCNFWEGLNALPSVTPRTNLAETSQDCISREAVTDTSICEGISCNECSFNTCEDGQSGCLLKERVDKLPSVYPERINLDVIERIKKSIDEMTEIHSDGEFYIKNVDVKWIINKYAYGDGGEEDDVS